MTKEEEVAKKIFVGGLPWNLPEQDLAMFFGKFGEVWSVNCPVNP
jgi:RNA recognition motif-containing protein